MTSSNSESSSISTPEPTDTDVQNQPELDTPGDSEQSVSNPTQTNFPSTTSSVLNGSALIYDEKWLDATTEPVWPLLTSLSQYGLDDDEKWSATASQIMAILQPLKERWHHLDRMRRSIQGPDPTAKRPGRRGRRGRQRA